MFTQGMPQHPVPHQSVTLGSEGSIGDIYQRTLSAYQSDINQLHEINN